MVCGRYAGFQQSLLKCKFPVRFLARLVQHDLRTVTGRNLRQIVLESGQGLLVQQFHYKTIIKKTMKYCPVPSSDAWRVSLLHDLLDIRNKMSTLTGFSTAEVEDMIKFICTSWRNWRQWLDGGFEKDKRFISLNRQGIQNIKSASSHQRLNLTEKLTNFFLLPGRICRSEMQKMKMNNRESRVIEGSNKIKTGNTEWRRKSCRRYVSHTSTTPNHHQQQQQ